MPSLPKDIWTTKDFGRTFIVFPECAYDYCHFKVIKLTLSRVENGFPKYIYFAADIRKNSTFNAMQYSFGPCPILVLCIGLSLCYLLPRSKCHLSCPTDHPPADNMLWKEEESKNYQTTFGCHIYHLSAIKLQQMLKC